jgi:hypothetical protein
MARASRRLAAALFVSGVLALGVAYAGGKQLGNGMPCTFSSDCASGSCSS